jgi:radical SAM superfamily enzyme YgiQ (UPF0313 family)
MSKLATSTHLDRVPAERPRRLKVCLINPKFELSYWGYDFALPLMPGDKRCWVVTGALPALAALVPPDCEVELLDENIEPIDYASLRAFDVIGITGMIVQGARMLEILRALKALPALVAVGGPYVSVAEHIFTDLCDARFVGEAEETWPAFLEAVATGDPVTSRYEQAAKTDMRCVPAPRYDLVKARHYMMASLQFSRGCPFLCEFCDIITVFGRRPRLKTPEQMIEEFEAVRRAGFRYCFLVDDNFIGNKREAKVFLRSLIAWQRAHGYPLQLLIEASIDLAEDAELIDLIAEANVRQVFIGIESPRRESLAEIRKVQNIRGDSLEAKIRRIRDGGLVVQAGFIVGFDHDDEAIFDEQFAFIQRTGIAHALVALLAPIPTTPLYERLRAEGRLDFADPDVIYQPKLMSRAALKHGYARLMERLYEPEAYFARLFAGYAGSAAFRHRRAIMDAARGRPIFTSRVGGAVQYAVLLFRLTWTLARARLLGHLGKAYFDAWARRNRPLGNDAIGLGAFLGICVSHWHFYNVAHHARKGDFGTVRPIAEKLVDNPVPGRPAKRVFSS